MVAACRTSDCCNSTPDTPTRGRSAKDALIIDSPNLRRQKSNSHGRASHSVRCGSSIVCWPYWHSKVIIPFLTGATPHFSFQTRGTIDAEILGFGAAVVPCHIYSDAARSSGATRHPNTDHRDIN